MEIADYLIDFPLPRVTNVAIGTNAVQLCPADPRRWFLSFTNYNLTCYAGISPQVSGTGNAILIMPQTINYPLYWKHHGILVTMAWYGIAGGPNSVLTVTEVFWQPPGG